MDITKFQDQHIRIFDCIRTLHRYSSQGNVEHDWEIAAMVTSMSSLIRLHLTVKDKVLYPALRSSNQRSLARVGERYQEDMKVIARRGVRQKMEYCSQRGAESRWIPRRCQFAPQKTACAHPAGRQPVLSRN